jgi:hypothetical protein
MHSTGAMERGRFVPAFGDRGVRPNAGAFARRGESFFVLEHDRHQQRRFFMSAQRMFDAAVEE